MNVRGFVICALLLAAGTSVALRGAPQENPAKTDLEKLLQQLLQERVKTAERATDSLQAAFDAQAVTLDMLVEAVNKLCKARLEIATTPAEEIDALEKRFKHMTEIEHKVETLYKIGARGGEEKEYTMAKRERESAQIDLIRARLKAMK
jgi:hypothetical protein